MTRYSTAGRQTTRRKEPTHAIWRGIGCLLILIVPVIAWIIALGTMSVATSSGWPLPYQLLGYPTIPGALWNIPGAPPILAFIQGRQNIYLEAVLTIVYIVLLSGLLSVVYAILYRFVGPPRYGPLDLPQPQIKVGRYKR